MKKLKINLTIHQSLVRFIMGILNAIATQEIAGSICKKYCN